MSLVSKPCRKFEQRSTGPSTGSLLCVVIQWGPLIPVLVLAAWLRNQRFRELGIWIDEAFTLRMSEFSWGEMPDRLARDTHPPLFNVLLKLWQEVVGDSPFAARLLPVSCGVVAVASMYLFVREAYWQNGASFGENLRSSVLPALVAATLLALAPMHTFWSLIIRMYSVATPLTLMSSYLLMRALRNETKRTRDWWWYSVSAALLGYAHYFGLFTLLAQFMFAIGYRLVRGKGGVVDRMGPVMLSFFCVWLAWQPWVPYFLEQRANVAHEFYLHGSVSELAGRAIHGLWVGPGMPASATTGWVIAQVSFLILLALLLGKTAGDAFIVAAATTPVICAIVVSHISRPLITAHYLQFSHVFMLAAVAIVACRVPHFGRLIGIIIVIGTMSLLSHEHYDWRESVATLPGARGAIAHYDDARNDGEALLTSSPFLHSLAIVHTRNSDNIFLFGAPGQYPFFTGTAVIRDEEYVANEWLSRSEQGFVWVLDGDQAFGRVPMSGDWRLVAGETYRDWYATFNLRLYARDNRQPHGASTQGNGESHVHH